MKHYKQKDVLDRALDILENTLRSDSKTVFEAITSIVRAFPSDIKIRDVFLKIAQKTLNELDGHTRHVLFFNIKSGYETKIMAEFPSREWEDMWIALIPDYNRIVLYVNCHKCGERYPIWLRILDWLNNTTITGSSLITYCRQCNTEIIIP